MLKDKQKLAAAIIQNRFFFDLEVPDMKQLAVNEKGINNTIFLKKSLTLLADISAISSKELVGLEKLNLNGLSVEKAIKNRLIKNAKDRSINTHLL